MTTGQYPECDRCDKRYFDAEKMAYCLIDENPELHEPVFCPYPEDSLEREDEFGERI